MQQDALERTKLDYFKLRRVCDPKSFRFKTTAEISPLTGLVGQRRAVEALRLGLLSSDKSYNIRAVLGGGTSRTSALVGVMADILKEDERELRDFCSVANMDDSHTPEMLILPRGKAEQFRREVRELLANMQGAIFEDASSDWFHKEIGVIADEWNRGSQEQESEFLRFSEQYGVKLWRVSMRNRAGISFRVLPETETKQFKDEKGNSVVGMTKEGMRSYAAASYPSIAANTVSGEPLLLVDPNFLESWIQARPLPEEQKEELRKLIEELENKFHEHFERAESARSEKLEELYESLVSSTFDELSDGLGKNYPEAGVFLSSLRRSAVKNKEMFFVQDDGQAAQDATASLSAIFDVNVLVDNSNTENAPIIVEDDPTFRNIFGRVIRPGGALAPNGTVMVREADHTSIQAGSLLRANGGALIIPLKNLVMSDDFRHTWRMLVNAIRAEEVAVEDIADRTWFFPAGSFKPKPIPLNVRVVLVADYALDGVFSQVFPEDYGLFRAKAEFVSEIKRTKAAERDIAKFLARCSDKDGLPHCTNEAVAFIVEYASWLAQDSRKLDLDFSKLKDLFLQAAYWARQRKKNAGEILGKDVKKALERSIYRLDAIREKRNEMRSDGVLKMAGGKDGRVGRINAIAVRSTGDFTFGSPSVVSAVTSPGSFNIVNVERNVGLGGRIQQKSVDIISGYLRDRYGENENGEPITLTLNAQIIFEQNYNMVDGDSASIAEFLAVISDLTDIPILPNIAITGSMSQHGDVQAIGGEGFKIEGFYDVWSVLGREKPEGVPTVIIPKDNSKGLMIRQDVVAAAKDGKLIVCAISTIDEAMEIAMAKPADEINAAIRACLKKFSESSKKDKDKDKDKKE